MASAAPTGKSPVHLLDSNVLIAASTPDHSMHERAKQWFAASHRFATSPITQGALVRFHMRFAVKPSMYTAQKLIAALTASPRHEFWPDSIGYSSVPDRGVYGHKQVTDAYLAALAAANGGYLATMDEALAALHGHALLI
jgi:uncharacterized protein